jgi:hypothetical protein
MQVLRNYLTPIAAMCQPCPSPVPANVPALSQPCPSPFPALSQPCPSPVPALSQHCPSPVIALIRACQPRGTAGWGTAGKRMTRQGQSGGGKPGNRWLGGNSWVWEDQEVDGWEGYSQKGDIPQHDNRERDDGP